MRCNGTGWKINPAQGKAIIGFSYFSYSDMQAPEQSKDTNHAVVPHSNKMVYHDVWQYWRMYCSL